MIAQDTTAIAAMLPTWVVALLIWTNGAFVTTIAALVWRAINARAIDAQITGARAAVEEIIGTNDRRYAQIREGADGRLARLETAMFGIDGDNGVRGDTRQLRVQVQAALTVLRRIGEAEHVDTKEIDALDAA